jgi:N-acetylneuraminate lyase
MDDSPLCTYSGTPVRGAAATSKKTAASPSASIKARNKVSGFTVNGLIAATFTPFTNAGDLKLTMIGPYANWLYQTGVNGVFVNGTNGESLSLTVAERESVLEAWLKESGGRFTVIAHVGCESIRDTCQLAEHAERNRASALGVMPTTFFKPSSIDQLIQYLSVVAGAAPSLPLFYYHIPSMTGVNLDMEEFLDAASSRLPTLRGIKYSSTDLHQLGRCVVHSGGRYSMLYGCDQQLLGALVMGCTAAVGSTYNYMGKLNNRLLAAVRQNDMETARLEQRRSQAVIRLLEKYGGHAGVGKELMRLQGYDLGPPRLPLLPLAPDQAKALEAGLRDVGFFNWA